ncbi:DUF4012 domain-containing protein [Paenarthrobacter nicotinovorans]|uniref:DUF4012 domain-containing protein n=1 Tax=Paenarthrobacter nicotinovorans TaxID=29320 RepID=UPI001668E2FE|nr:DUF4012 domain-containing protein [Paenarthrobacter nicotinovorans]MBP2395570.1 hypothetical protein [Paenarthrobacter nicotinovorans]UKE98311.1 DUF4012 domain-containing protein [Paenarthrobacter nicotinovorans]UKF03098.1 DUF4012 domain-containing protein [Paenarthrobacter nicotinovorans]GGV23408.1 hypothetical protein GCM10010212_06210 [Paenarthrobacter nicotinovorans]
MSPNSGSNVTRSKRKIRQRLKIAGIWSAAIAIVLIAASAWLGSRAAIVKTELHAATQLLPNLKTAVAENDAVAATETVETLVQHTGKARDAASDPLWKAAAVLPWIGPNLQAASEVATSADDVARLGATPLVKAFQSLDWKALTPTNGPMDLAPLEAAAPMVDSAAYAVRESVQRLNHIPTDSLMAEVSAPLIDAREKLTDLQGELDSAADAAKLAPNMLGANSPRRYLLLMQNNAEIRATGGIPGAVAVLDVDKGSLKLESQTSAAALGSFVPPIAVDAEQQAIYSGRIGKFMQDVNLTPDFATSARTAQAMWEKSTGERLDGVLSLDPVALSFILDATGPVQIKDPVVQQIGRDLPAQLTGKNVVQTLLSDAYAKIDEPKLQDVYFAGAAKEIFGALSSGKTDPKKLMEALSRGAEERRILLWSAAVEEESTIGQYALGGMVSGASISPAQFGVYFNDGTGAKMDYWVKRSVQIVKDCTRDGYREVTVRVTSTNSAPIDAAKSLPAYVTGGGAFGIPAGSVQTNVVAYGPVQSNIDTVVKDGEKVPFAAQRHSQRAVGTSTIRLAPGQSTTLDFNFGHIVQDSEPKVVVTPTTQPVEDVIQATSKSTCE